MEHQAWEAELLVADTLDSSCRAALEGRPGALISVENPLIWLGNP